MPGFKERHAPEGEQGEEKKKRPEGETGLDVFGERREAFRKELALTKEESEEAMQAVREAKLHASKQEHLTAGEQEELKAIEDEADAIRGRYEALQKKAREGGILDAIAEEVVTTAVIESVIPAAPVAKMVEHVAPLGEIAAEDEDTPEERRRKEREKREREGS